MKARKRNAATLLVAGALTLGAGQAWAEDPSASTTSPPTAEAPAESEEVLVSGKVEHGGYGAPVVKATAVAGSAAMFVGGEGAWVIGHTVTLGGGGYGLVTSVDAPEQARSPLADSTLGLGYGGPRLGFVLRPHMLVHFSAGLLIGGGGVSIIEHRGTDSNVYQSASVFVLEPAAAVELNISRGVHAALDVSYRYMSDSRIAGLSPSKLSAPSAGLAIKFGWF